MKIPGVCLVGDGADALNWLCHQSLRFLLGFWVRLPGTQVAEKLVTLMILFGRPAMIKVVQLTLKNLDRQRNSGSGQSCLTSFCSGRITKFTCCSKKFEKFMIGWKINFVLSKRARHTLVHHDLNFGLWALLPRWPPVSRRSNPASPPTREGADHPSTMPSSLLQAESQPWTLF